MVPSWGSANVNDVNVNVNVNVNVLPGIPITAEDQGAKLGQRKFSQKASTPSAERCEPNKQPLLNDQKYLFN